MPCEMKNSLLLLCFHYYTKIDPQSLKSYQNRKMNEMPDPDAIKMFVGQIPKTWNENDVRVYFEEFGLIFLINVLRDKVTKQSRG